MTLSTKVSMVFMAMVNYIFIGIAIQADKLWWGLLLLLLTIIIYLLDYFVRRKNVHSRFLKFVPILLLSLYIYGIVQGNQFMIEHPLDVQLLTVEEHEVDYDQVKISYGFFGGETDFSTTNNVSALHNEALRPTPPLLVMPFKLFVAFPGVVLYALLLVMFVNENKHVNKQTKRTKLSDIE